MSSTKNKIKDKATGIIYLIQPAELVGTNRFKIGCSCQNGLNRCVHGYKLGSRYLYIIECKNPFELEAQLIIHFKSKFKLIAGNEYFEGIELEIKSEFLKIVNNYADIFINPIPNEISDMNELQDTVNKISYPTKVDAETQTDITMYKKPQSTISPLWFIINRYILECNITQNTILIKRPTEIHRDLNMYCRQRGLNNPEDTNSIKTKLLDIDTKCFKRIRIPSTDGKEKRDEQYVLEIAKIREYMVAKNLNDTTIDN